MQALLLGPSRTGCGHQELRASNTDHARPTALSHPLVRIHIDAYIMERIFQLPRRLQENGTDTHARTLRMPQWSNPSSMLAIHHT